jgi:hypothetical protein
MVEPIIFLFNNKGVIMKIIMLTLALVATLSTSCSTHSSKWECMKDGNSVVVQGDNAKDKKASCEANMGTWTEVQSAGKGAGW